MPRTVKDYHFNNLAGCVLQSVARETGTLVGVYHGWQSGIEGDPETLRELPWYTVCEVHHTLVGHRLLRLARDWAAEPGGWCEDCQEVIKNRAARAKSMLPDIAIPRSSSFGANQDRYGIGDGSKHQECLLCAKPIKGKTVRVVLLTDDLGKITDPTRDQETTGGCFFIGPDCWRSHPELHPYEVKGV